MPNGKHSLIERVDVWLSLQQPVTYWSFWRRLLKVSPLLLVAVLAAVAIAGGRLTILPFAPVPYVFVAATFGFAVRRLDGRHALVSIGVGTVYTAVIASLGILSTMFTSPSMILTIVAILTFVAAIAGFGSPSLHQGFQRSKLTADRQDRREF